jgi:hypothetical protein
MQCAGCQVYHKFIDNLGLVVEYDLREQNDTQEENVGATDFENWCVIRSHAGVQNVLQFVGFDNMNEYLGAVDCYYTVVL